MRRIAALLPVLIAFQAGAPPALAWTWPVDGPVLRPFVFGDDPYAAGQHRGIDIGAPAGASVRAPAPGSVSFAGTVPGGGRTLTLRTADGYSLTLLHLGTIVVERGADVAEGAAVGTIGPSGDAEVSEPYVHLGIRLTADEQGYVDPLSILPARSAPVPSEDSRVAKTRPSSATPKETDARASSSGGAARAHQPRRGPRRRAPATAVHVAAPRGSGQRRSAVLPEGRRRSVHPARGGAARSSRLRAVAAPRPVERALPTAVDSKPPTSVARTAGGTSPAGSQLPPWFAAVVLLGALAGVALVVRRRQLRHAGSAHALASVLLDGARRAAEDANRPRPIEEDRLVSDGDLECVALRQPEALADLDGNDDPAQLVKVPNDPSGRLASSMAARRGFHRSGPHRSSRSCRAETSSVR
jgi:Peptidase family M23